MTENSQPAVSNEFDCGRCRGDDAILCAVNGACLKAEIEHAIFEESVLMRTLRERRAKTWR